MAPRLAVLVTALLIAIPGALAVTFSFRNSVTPGDPDQKGQLVADDPETTCALPTGAALGAREPTNYDLYRFRNASDTRICVKVLLEPDPLLCPVNNSLQSAAYSPAFDPANITADYLGDSGARPDTAKAYSFEVPPGVAFDVTVNETNPNAGCNSYTLTVEGPGIIGAPTSVGVTSFTARRVAHRVLLRWRTAAAAQQSAFNVYREQAGLRIRLNRRPITGRTWRARRIANRYWLEELRADGSRRWHGPARLLRH